MWCDVLVITPLLLLLLQCFSQMHTQPGRLSTQYFWWSTEEAEREQGKEFWPKLPASLSPMSCCCCCCCCCWATTAQLLQSCALSFSFSTQCAVMLSLAELKMNGTFSSSSSSKLPLWSVWWFVLKRQQLVMQAYYRIIPPPSEHNHNRKRGKRDIIVLAFPSPSCLVVLPLSNSIVLLAFSLPLTLQQVVVGVFALSPLLCVH